MTTSNDGVLGGEYWGDGWGSKGGKFEVPFGSTWWIEGDEEAVVCIGMAYDIQIEEVAVIFNESCGGTIAAFTVYAYCPA